MLNQQQSDTAQREFTRKIKHYCRVSYQEDVPKSLGKAESCLGEALDLINVIYLLIEAGVNNE